MTERPWKAHDAILRDRMLTTRRARFLTVCFSLLFLLVFSAGPASAEGKNVLILHAFEANQPINVMTSQGLMPTLEAGGVSRP